MSKTAIGFFENTPDLELTNDVFSENALFSQSAVMRLLLRGERLTLPAFMGRAASRMKFSNALKAAIGEQFGAFM